MSDEIRKWIAEEVARQVSTLTARIEQVNRYLLSLYSNGSGGPPGYLEVARSQDDRRFEDKESRDNERFEQLIEKIAQLQSYVSREQGKDDLRREREAAQIEIEKLRELKKTGLFTRLHAVIAIGASFFGAYFWTLVRHVLRPLLDQLIK